MVEREDTSVMLQWRVKSWVMSPMETKKNYDKIEEEW